MNSTLRKVRYTLERLPAWGETVRPEEINFQWPTQEVFDQMDSQVYLKSIQFKNNGYGAVTSVACFYSNDEESPVFEQANYKHKQVQMLDFEAMRPVRKVGANCNVTPFRYVIRMRFLDS